MAEVRIQVTTCRPREPACSATMHYSCCIHPIHAGTPSFMVFLHVQILYAYNTYHRHREAELPHMEHGGLLLSRLQGKQGKGGPCMSQPAALVSLVVSRHWYLIVVYAVIATACSCCCCYCTTWQAFNLMHCVQQQNTHDQALHGGL